MSVPIIIHDMLHHFHNTTKKETKKHTHPLSLLTTTSSKTREINFNGNPGDPSENDPQEHPLQHRNKATQNHSPIPLSCHRYRITRQEAVVSCYGCLGIICPSIRNNGDGGPEFGGRGAAVRVGVDAKIAPVLCSYACDSCGARGGPGNEGDEVSGVPERGAEESPHGCHERDVLRAILRRRGRRHRRTEHQRAQRGRLTWHAGVRCGRRT